jgi:hypothetical protein
MSMGCNWDPQICDDPERPYPIGETTREEAKLLAESYAQMRTTKIKREEDPSRDFDTDDGGPEGIRLCWREKAVIVTHMQWVEWCLKIYRTKPRNRKRKIAGIALMVLGAAATVAVPPLVFVHIATLGTGAVTAAGSLGLGAGGMVAGGAQGVRTGRIKVGPPIRCERYENYLDAKTDPDRVSKLIHEPGARRLCVDATHRSCK